MRNVGAKSAHTEEDMMESEERVKVLIVDDHPENLIALESVLEGPELILTRAYSGKEALKYLLEDEYAVILLDVQMPDMDGFETATLIRAREKTRNIPILFLTAINKSDTHVFQGYSVGAIDYVFKPFEPEILRAKVQAFIEIYRNTRKLQKEIEHRRRTEEKLDASNALLETISQALMGYIAEGNLTPTFQKLLNTLLTLSQSEYGFLGEVLFTPKGDPYLKTFVIAMETHRRRPRTPGRGEEGEAQTAALKSLCASILPTGQTRIVNGLSAEENARVSALGAMPIHNYLAMPLTKGKSLMGVVGIANRPDGYDEGLMIYLNPFLHTCASIIDANRNALRRQMAEDEVRQLNEELECRVVERTAELESANQDLQNEILERQRAEKVLARHQAHIQKLNERLRRSMTETHHRVKNNLQVIASMLDMRLMEGEETIPIEEIRRLGIHVRTLAAVHDLLTQESKEDGQANSLHACPILNQLLPMLQETAEGRTIQFAVDDVRLSARQGTSLALVVNELVSNAIKYGKGTIDVNFAVVEEKAVLKVCDDGPGFPPDFDPIQAAHTGLDLIEHLSHWDLGGKTYYQNRKEGGACVRIEIPISEPGDPDGDST